MKLIQVDRALAEQHYGEHVGKPFYEGLVGYITSSPIIAAVLEGTGAVEAVRTTMGKTNPREAGPGTIRGDLGMSFSNNLVHASDGPESAARELGIFFAKDELVAWTPAALPWVYSVEEELKP